MSKANPVKFKNLSELPEYLTVNEVCDYFSVSRPEVDRWFNSRDFPKIEMGFKRVNKYDLVEWLQKNKGNPRAKYLTPDDAKYQLQEDIRMLNENVELLLNKGG